jgi:hypothetical protein
MFVISISYNLLLLLFSLSLANWDPSRTKPDHLSSLSLSLGRPPPQNRVQPSLKEIKEEKEKMRDG